MVQPPLKLKPHVPPNDPESLSSANRRRSAWRRRLVEAERGLTEGFRADSTLIVHFFLATMVMAAALVLGISLLEWGMLILSLTMVFSAELFHLVVRSVIRALGHHFPEPAQKIRQIATAGVFITITGAVLTVVLIFSSRLWGLFTDS